MCILCFETFDHLHDELVLVLDEYVLLPLVDDSVDLQITLIGFGLKNLALVANQAFYIERRDQEKIGCTE